MLALLDLIPLTHHGGLDSNQNFIGQVLTTLARYSRLPLNFTISALFNEYVGVIKPANPSIYHI